MFRTRLISGIVLIAAAFGLLYAGGIVLAAGLLVISLVGCFELYRILYGKENVAALPALTGYAAVTAWYWYDIYACLAVPGLTRDMYSMLVLAIFLILLMSVFVFTYPRWHANQIMGTFFGVFYVAVTLNYICRVRQLDHGVYLVWLVFLGSWGCDTLAYCSGMLFGRHKMAPVLSPKKSVEGAVGGVLGAALLGALYGFAVSGAMQGKSLALEFALICAVSALVAMVGDLAASAIKRNFQVKDYGTLIPGHGGILDRFDSVIFIAPVIYYLCLFLLR